MGKLKSYNDIPSMGTDWANDPTNGLPFAGLKILEFIKKQFGKKVGSWGWTELDDYYHLIGFASETDKNKYLENPKTYSDLLLVDETLPISITKDEYGAFVWCDIPSTKDLIVNGDNLNVNLRFSSVKITGGEKFNLGLAGSLTIQRKTVNSDWTTVAILNNVIQSTDYTDTENYTKINLGNYLVTGKLLIRITASFNYSSTTNTTKTASSTYIMIGTSITKTTVSLTCQQNWQTPIYASAQQSKGYPISYMVYGAVAKTLHVEITGGAGKTLSLTYPLTADQDSATITKNVSDSTDTYKLWKHGVRTVKAWLTADDGQGGTITSDTLVNRFMVVNPTTDADKTTPYLMIQNLVSKCDNYAQADLCQYAVFSPSDDATGNNGAAVKTIFYLTDYSEDFPNDNPTQYFRIESSVSPGTANTLNTTIEIEATDDEQTNIPAYFRVWRDTGGVEENFMLASMGVANAVINVDNSESYAPKSGADFVLNPKTRNNSESNPMTIINAKTGEEIESTWTGFGLVKDGWVASDEDGQRVLRVPAGAKVNFKYNPFAQFLQAADSSLEIELDIKTRNVTNEDDPIISLFEDLKTTDSSGNVTTTFRGLKIQPMKGEIHTKSNAVSSETDFNWREGQRTHIAINIHNAVAANKGDALVPSTSTYDTSATKIALVRVFINGDIEREYKYSITDSEEFCTAAMSNGGFTIGQQGADIDIYGIRVYQNTALEAEEVRADYVSTLPTTAEKQEQRSRNDILTGGKIDLEKCRNKGYRCIVWHGVEPYKENTSSQKGYWEIFQYDAKGNYMPEYSGTICKASQSLPTKRQGSTANTYYYSNIQTKFNDVTATINVKLSELHPSISWQIEENYTDGDTPVKEVALTGGCLGKNFPVKETAVSYPYVEIDGEDGVTVPDGWIDGNGKYRGQMYQLNGDVAYFQKGVLKINYASSMQSHLPGVNNIYNDLHRAIVGPNSLQDGYSKARVSKYTEPFMFFTQALDSDTPVYRGPATWGAGKMDKPTWGYVKKLHPMFAMFEGSDNNYDLTDMRVPFTWGCPDCPENITYSADDEGFFYNGQQNIDFDGGATDDNDVPKSALIETLQGAWNFLYLHSPSIQYYKGTFDKFQVSDEAKNTFNKYWCTDGSEAYLLKRYDYVNKAWVDAGLWDDTDKKWSTVDLRTDSMTADTYTGSTNQSEYKALNVELKGAIVAHAKKYIGWYFKAKSVQLYYTLIIHLFCGTDNCSKNTYYVIDPKAQDVTIDGETKSCYLMELHTDDVDTMLPIDNNGRTTKAYYLDRMHPYMDGDTTTEKYEGMHNTLFNLVEAMYEDTKELQTMAKSIFTTMESLVDDTDYIAGFPSDGQKVSVYGCMWKYIYFIQSYFPQVAFNEAARIRYEYPEQIGFVSYGSGARGVRPITQSNGALLQCELQFIERRLVLMASYAAWGPFADGKSGNLGIADATESFSMQAFHLPDSATSLNTYAFTVTPHQYIYPCGMLGQTSVDPHVRVAPGEAYTLELGSTTSNDTGMSISGINYYRSIGNVGDLSTTPANTITINGKRLTEFVAEPSKTYTDSDTGVEMPAFRPGAFALTAKNLKKFSVKGCTQTSGNIDLSSETRLEEVDARQTKLADITLPSSATLTTVRLPETVTSVSLTDNPNVSTLTIEGYKNLTKFVIQNNTLLDIHTHVVGMYKAQPALKTVTIENIAWGESEAISADMMMWLADIPATLKGSITLLNARSDRYITVSDKMILGKRYGNIDSTDNPLYISYTLLGINTISISGDTFMTEVGKDYQQSLVASPVNGNNIAVDENGAKVKWAIASSADPYAHWVDDMQGIIHVDALSDGSLDQKHTMTVTAETTTGATLTAEKKVGFYRHIPIVGDFAYADGTFDGEWDSTRDFVGLVFMRLPIYGEDGTTLVGYDVRVVSKENLTITSSDGGSTWTQHQWGLYPDNFSSVETDIEEAAGVVDAFDIAELADITTRWNGSQVVDGVVRESGTYNGVRYEDLNKTTYLDSTQPDGYKVIKAGAATADYNGKSNTEKIVAHAKKIVSGYLGKTWPSTLTELGDALAAIMSENSSASAPRYYCQFYYPAAWSCALYEPSGAADCYKSGQWYLPGCGELCRIANYCRQGVTADTANFEAENEATTPIFANAASKAGKTLVPVWNGKAGTGYYTSTEYNREYVWQIGEAGDSTPTYQIGSFGWLIGTKNGERFSNYSRYYARPCCSVTFNLSD